LGGQKGANIPQLLTRQTWAVVYGVQSKFLVFILIKRKQGGSEKKLVGFYANAWRRPPEFSRGQGFGHLTAGIYLRGGRGQEAAVSLPSAGNPLSGKAGKLRESRGESISFFTPPFPYYLIRFLLFDICALMNFNAFISFKGLCLFLY